MIIEHLVDTLTFVNDVNEKFLLKYFIGYNNYSVYTISIAKYNSIDQVEKLVEREVVHLFNLSHDTVLALVKTLSKHCVTPTSLSEVISDFELS